MSDDLAARVYTHAMALSTAMAQEQSAVDELIAVARGDRAVLEAAHRRAQAELERAAGERTRAVGDEEAPEAPALLASRLLGEAIEQLERA